MSLEQKLKVARAAVTKSCGSVHSALTISGCKFEDVCHLAEALKSKNDRLEELNSELSESLEGQDDSMVLPALEKIEEYREKVSILLGKCTFLEKSFSLPIPIATTAASTPSSGSLSLPKLQLPTFSGDILMYNDFIEQFKNAVDLHKISSVQKFNYLKSLLKDEAYELVAGLELSSSNYTVALDLLKERYGSTKRLLRAHVRKLLSLNCSDKKDTKSFRAFVDNVNKHTRGLDTLGIPCANYDVFLCEILIDKVPNRVKSEWAERPDNEMTLDTLLKLVETEAKRLDIIYHTTSSPSVTPTSITRTQKSPHYNSPRTSFYNNNIKIVRRPCNICRTQEHTTYECPKLLQQPVETRHIIVRRNNLCINCLGTHSAKCTSRHTCNVCGRPHHTLLHYNNVYKRNTETIETPKNTETTEVGANAINVGRIHNCVLPVTCLPLRGLDSDKKIGALLDSGSQRSFINTRALKSIQYTGCGSLPLRITGFGGSTRENCDVIEVQCKIENRYMSLKLIVTESFKIIDPGDHNKNNQILTSHGLKPIDSTDQIPIVIGSDYFYRFVTGSSVKLSDSLFAIETIFGWTIHGDTSSLFLDVFSNNISHETNISDDFAVEKFWNNETSGILPHEEVNDISHSNLLSNFHSNLSRDCDGRYVAKFPWIKNTFLVSSYESESKLRLNHTLRRLLKLNMLNHYDGIIKEYLSLDIIEVAPKDCDFPRYLPHHPVVQLKHKTTKVRIVFDASSKNKGELSLNDCMEEGPNLYPSIIGIIIRFRLFKYAISGDIEKAFLQIGLHEDERDRFRFLWYDERLDQNWPTNPEVAYRFKRVPFGAKSSPFVLNATIRYHLKDSESEFPITSPLLSKSLYVDDFIVSYDSLEDLKIIQQESISLLSQIRMNMHKWNSNCHEIIPPADDCSVLGIGWNPKLDTLSIKLHEKVVSTKRELTSLVCSIFDPLGYFSPFTIKLKLLLQDAWLLKLSWDDKLPADLLSQISTIQEDIVLLNKTSIPRHLGVLSISEPNVSLYVFADASSRAYAASVYLCVDNEMHLIISKSRLASKQSMTLPRLELMGCLIASRLCQTVIDELHIAVEHVYAFSDSTVALAWIANTDKYFKQFVDNRVQEIRKTLPVDRWYHISGKYNPIDYATKCFALEKWIDNSFWWGGTPLYNYIQTEVFAKNSSEIHEDMIQNAEYNKEIRITQMTNHTQLDVIDFARFSSYSKLLMTVFYILKWRYSSKSDIDKSSVNHISMNKAKQTLYRLSQIMNFHDEYTLLLNNLEIPPKSRIFQLKPFLDENRVMRSNSRISSSDVSYNIKYPIILNSDCTFTHLLIEFYHKSMVHAGTHLLLTTLRKKFWIIRCRMTVKSVLNKCKQCRRFSIKPIEQPFSPLVSDRVSTLGLRVFESTGIDYAGPFLLTADRTKHYILLFTCLKVRAIHLELTNSLDTVNFLRAFHRFKARRGCPSLLRSDNAKTFHKASLHLLKTFGTQWKFSTELAPWTGGVWERLVRTVKSCLRVIFKSARKSVVEFETCLCQIEEVINRRPITYTTGNDSEVLPLTPMNFLIIPHADNPSDVLQNTTLVQPFVENHTIMRQFWSRWRNEYLPCLIPSKSKALRKEVQVDDVVLLNDGPKREYWPLARVLETRVGRDGVVRTVKLNCRGKTMMRPTKLIYPLETNLNASANK